MCLSSYFMVLTNKEPIGVDTPWAWRCKWKQPWHIFVLDIFHKDLIPNKTSLLSHNKEGLGWWPWQPYAFNTFRHFTACDNSYNQDFQKLSSHRNYVRHSKMRLKTVKLFSHVLYCLKFCNIFDK